MFGERRKGPSLPCPECRLHGHGGLARIGNRRGRGCETCNSFSRQIERVAARRLKEKYLAEYERFRMQAELDLYPQVIESFSRRMMIAEKTASTRTGAAGSDE